MCVYRMHVYVYMGRCDVMWYGGASETYEQAFGCFTHEQ